MKYSQAEAIITAIATIKGGYCYMSYGKMTFASGATETKCYFDIEGEQPYSGPTWADALRAREIDMKQDVEQEAPDEVAA